MSQNKIKVILADDNKDFVMLSVLISINKKTLMS